MPCGLTTNFCSCSLVARHVPHLAVSCETSPVFRRREKRQRRLRGKRTPRKSRRKIFSAAALDHRRTPNALLRCPAREATRQRKASPPARGGSDTQSPDESADRRARATADASPWRQ
eukprot:scaffold227256_cov30-Tisochrysis_lutea.AAC.2